MKIQMSPWLRELPKLLSYALVAAALSRTHVSAQQIGLVDKVDGCDFMTGQIHAQCIPNYIAYVIQWFFILRGFFFVLVMIWAGYEFAISGATQNREGGKERLKWGIIGFLTSVLAFALVDFVISTMGGV